MPVTDELRRGDVVVHPRRPEWGAGTIESAVAIVHEGKPAQRLTVNFVNHGRVTINTAIAPLLPKGIVDAMNSRSALSSGLSSTSSSSATVPSWLAPSKTGAASAEELWKLPESMTDPFASWSKRLEATLESYRYGSDTRNAKAILEWAMAQTSLNDPLSKYTRHELEQAFPRYLRDRDNHLYQMVRTLKKQGKSDVLNQVFNSPSLNAAGKAALQKAMRN